MGLMRRWGTGGMLALSSASSLNQQIEIGGPMKFTSISSNFSWTDIQPTPDLRYVDCGGGFQCARLELPLDWNATANSSTYDEKYAMAIVRLPAQVPVTDTRYGGPIIINPGGPGGSGTKYALESGMALQTAYDAAYSYGSDTYLSNNSNARYFDIIGFDPRGVGNSTPWHTCFQTSSQLLLFNNQGANLQLNYPDDNLDLIWQRSIARAQDCIWDPKTNINGSKIAKFGSTAMVARDLVEFAEKNGEWREKLARTTDAGTQQRLKWDKGNEQLQISMVSYGTILGATLAAMQPHRVKCFVLDGVASSEEYYNGNLTSDTHSADDLVTNFFSYCATAGPDQCAMWAGNSSSDTRNRLQAILDDIKANGSIPVFQSPEHTADVITLGDVKSQILSLGYDPLTSWLATANALAPLTYRNGSALAVIKQAAYKDTSADDSVDFDPDDPATGYGVDVDAFPMISGGDTSLRVSPRKFVTGTWTALRNTTYWTADAWATVYQPQFTWPTVFPWRFGDTHAVASNVTANPILFASMLVDGVTSLASAQQLTSRFKGSGLLIVDGEGHTTAAEPSLCAGKAFRYYFQTGRLPDTSRHCLPARRPFGYGNVEVLSGLSMEDKVLALAQAAITGIELDLS